MMRITLAGRRLLIGPAWVALAVLAGAAPCVAQDSTVVDPTPVATDHELRQKYIWSKLGLQGALRATLSSGLGQWRDSPEEWATGGTGYSRRFASAYAESAIGGTATYAVARILHHDPSSTRCECSGFAKRVGHAASAPFMARTRNGTRVLSPATVTGVLAGYVVPASIWHPAPRGARDGLQHVATNLASKIGVNVFKEFWRRR